MMRVATGGEGDVSFIGPAGLTDRRITTLLTALYSHGLSYRFCFGSSDMTNRSSLGVWPSAAVLVVADLPPLLLLLTFGEESRCRP